MKQGLLRGFGAAYLTGAHAPIDMPDDVVTLCKSEADAVTHSVNFAKRRFGYTQADIAKLCGWNSDNHLSEIKKGRRAMPETKELRFAQVTACNLLAQYKARVAMQKQASGNVSPNHFQAVVLARMLAVAA